MTNKSLNITVLPGNFAVCRLGPNDAMPEMSDSGLFISVTRTSDELSIICEEHLTPTDSVVVKGWACLKVEGPFDFSEIGVIASISKLLAVAEISLLSISSFETDYVMIKWNQMEQAVAALQAGGHNVIS